MIPVFSETESQIVTYNIPADSAWNVDGLGHTNLSIRSETVTDCRSRSNYSLIWKKYLYCFNLTDYLKMSEKFLFNISKYFLFTQIKFCLKFLWVFLNVGFREAYRALLLKFSLIQARAGLHNFGGMIIGFFIKAFSQGRCNMYHISSTGAGLAK